jgi:hypothetical protein
MCYLFGAGPAEEHGGKIKKTGNVDFVFFFVYFYRDF